MAKRDAKATKARILAAAVAEFANYGFFGARIDRVAAAAKANKNMIYVYFGSKDGLFDAVMDAAIEDIHESVPFTPGDLPGFGAHLFDFLVAHPVEVRIDAWRRLERPSRSTLEKETFADKIAALDKLRSNDDRTSDSAELLIMVLAIAWSRVTAPAALGELATDDVALRREHVIRSIEALDNVMPRRVDQL